MVYCVNTKRRCAEFSAWFGGGWATALCLYAFLGVCFSITLGVAAVVDYSNHQTLPLASWRGATIILAIAMAVGMLLSFVTLLRFPGQSAFTTNARLLAKPGDTGSACDYRAYCVDRVCTQSMYFVSQTVLAIWALARVCFLYRYVSVDGQRDLDGGFPNDGGIWSYTVQRKNDFLDLVQLQAFFSVACLVGFIVKFSAQRVSKCK